MVPHLIIILGNYKSHFLVGKQKETKGEVASKTMCILCTFPSCQMTCPLDDRGSFSGW